MLDNILSALFENLMSLMPFVIIRSDEMGCRWTFGVDPHELKPGWHWRVYLFHQIETLTVVDDAIELPVQSVITKDEKLVCFRVGFSYRVSDIVKHCCNVTDFTTSTAILAKQHLAKRVREMTLHDLVADLGKLEKSLETTLSTRFKQWGTEVISVGFIDFAEVATQVRVFGDTKGAV